MKSEFSGKLTSESPPHPPQTRKRYGRRRIVSATTSVVFSGKGPIMLPKERHTSGALPRRNSISADDGSQVGSTGNHQYPETHVKSSQSGGEVNKCSL